VDWWAFDPDTTEVDPIYSVGSYDGGGRRWKEPFRLEVVLATISQGPVYQNDRGFYVTDNLTLLINSVEMYAKLPAMPYSPDVHLVDRIVYREKVFVPTLIYPKGHIQGHLVIGRVDAEEVKPEEVVNDPQFAHLVS
jgi:hypothetical protein